MGWNSSNAARIAVAAGVVCLGACGPRETVETRRFEGPTMGTTYHVTVPGIRDEAGAKRVQDCIDRTLVAVDRHLSTYAKDSEISALNANASTDWIPVSNALVAVVAAAQRVSTETEGAFDITVAPLVRLWGFGAGATGAGAAKPYEPPSMEFVHDAMANVGYSWLELRLQPAPAVRRGKVPLELDVDGIAPGYAVDRASACLAHVGFASHLVEIGGEVRAAGRRDDGQPWRVAIESPVMEPRQAYAGVELSDLAISTSGNYRDFQRLPDGRLVSHTIDPRTGEPIRHALASVTVVHPRATLADAYATAFMVLGPEEGLVLADRLGVPALFLERIGQSQALRERATASFNELRRPIQ
ncbi:MAG TPA: FAD:protein FMN transferase [Steroidobacteraceae bacterium]|nr:FAD:protein FMN transferase [Steroidobacteraceae bacterium]